MHTYKCISDIHACAWEPEGEPKAVVQIVHGIAEYALRYRDFAEFLTDHGFLVVAEDHMGHGKSISDRCPQGCFSGGWFAAVADTYASAMASYFAHKVNNVPNSRGGVYKAVFHSARAFVIQGEM